MIAGLENWLGGIAALVGTVLVQFAVQTLLLRLFLVRLAQRSPAPHGAIGASWRLSLVTVLVLIFGHLLQVMLWALLYRALGELRDMTDALYFSLASFTTLGANELELSRSHRTLGAVESGAGILMFGWSGAILVALVGVARHTEEAGRRDAP